MPRSSRPRRSYSRPAIRHSFPAWLTIWRVPKPAELDIGLAWVRDAVKHRRIHSTCVNVWLALMEALDRETGVCCPSQQWLALNAGLHRSVLNDRLAELEAEGFITRQRRYEAAPAGAGWRGRDGAVKQATTAYHFPIREGTVPLDDAVSPYPTPSSMQIEDLLSARRARARKPQPLVEIWTETGEVLHPPDTPPPNLDDIRRRFLGEGWPG